MNGPVVGVHMGLLVGYMEKYCSFRGWNYDEIVMETWNRVKQRDWQKNKETGGDVPTTDVIPPDGLGEDK